ncbi:hypothetical protein GH714_036986 [Hevea brasiliensis]|uniref:Peptidase A1 domain-containing protein n=1 Tax=Hevea brasiliensis TaxID=3981 RepID=A0A6A6NF85_HEVBR|nr:hypothetical protein GH714_036986 [Hevea brasiliensis]
MLLLPLHPLVSLPLLLLLLLVTSITTNTISYPDFQFLNVKEAITETKTRSFKTSQYQEPFKNQNDTQTNGQWKLKLVHRDKISFNNSNLLHARIHRDMKRVASLIRRLSGTASYTVEDFGAEVVSGMDQGVSCSSAVCDRVDNSGCHAGRCRYEVMYGDGSYTKGTLALETLTFGRTVVRNVAIGCGHRNRGMFVGAAGLLGLGGGSMSLVGQLGGQTGGAFSYCLVSRGSEVSGSLEFGRGAMPVGAAWIPLIRNPRAPSFYYIGLSGLGVGGMKVPISEEVFQLNEVGNGGVVMDTGTAVTRLPTVAYVAFRNAFIAQTGNLPRASGISIFDTCYNLFGFVSVRVPTVSFYFSGGPILTLPANNFLIPVDDVGTYCFAFAASPSGLSIIGNIQQEGIQISFDGANGFVGFGPNVC